MPTPRLQDIRRIALRLAISDLVLRGIIAECMARSDAAIASCAPHVKNYTIVAS